MFGKTWYEISYGYGKDVKLKFKRCLSIFGTKRRTLKSHANKESLMKFYNVMYVPVLHQVTLSHGWVTSLIAQRFYKLHGEQIDNGKAENIFCNIIPSI